MRGNKLPMRLIFPYRDLLTSNPGIAAIPRPIITISLVGPHTTRISEAIVDTAADHIVFPERIAGQIGIQLTTGRKGKATVASGAEVPVTFATVTLRILDIHGIGLEWDASVGFTPVEPVMPMIGFTGFLEYLVATFDSTKEELSLKLTRRFPGTTVKLS